MPSQDAVERTYLYEHHLSAAEAVEEGELRLPEGAPQSAERSSEFVR